MELVGECRLAPYNAVGQEQAPALRAREEPRRRGEKARGEAAGIGMPALENIFMFERKDV